MNIEDYLKEYARLENEELNSTFLEITKELEWIFEIFILVSKFENLTLDSLSSKWRTSIALSQTAFKEIHLCFLSIGRKHISQAFSNMRLAVEATGFINAIRDNPEKGEIWRSRKFKETNSKPYQALETLRWSGTLGPELKNRFGSASEQSHANLVKMLFWIKSEIDEKESKARITDQFAFFDNPEPADWLITSTHWLIDTCFIILLLLVEVFKEPLGETDFETSVHSKYKKYKDFIKNNLDRVLVTHKLK